MPVFYGEMHPLDEPGRMPAVVTVNAGTIRLVSGRTELGAWKLSEVVVEEHTDRSALLKADDGQLVLFLDDHVRFLAETSRARPRQSSVRRPTHPAFRRQDEGPSLSEELREDVGREVTSILDEARDLTRLVRPGPPLWIGIGVLLLLVILVPTLVVGISLLAGVLALAGGAVAYADQRLALRMPGSLTPARLVAMGGVLVAAGVVVALIR